MRISRRQSLAWAALALGFASFNVPAQSWPERPVRLIVPFAAGSFPDPVARVVGEKMSAGLRQPVVIDNRPGAGGNLGTEARSSGPSRQGAVLVLLLCGSDKGDQDRAIRQAIEYLNDWKERGRP